MGISAELRFAVRAAFGGRCGYCGVSETSVGGELEIDHFHPLTAGGSDDIRNLVYACTACNRFKGDYAAANDTPESLRLLHPLLDDVRAHIAETGHGRLIGLTPRGWFHLDRLHLNRPLLVDRRQLQRALSAQKEELAQSHQAEARLREEIRALETEIDRLRVAMADLVRRGER